MEAQNEADLEALAAAVHMLGQQLREQQTQQAASDARQTEMREAMIQQQRQQQTVMNLVIQRMEQQQATAEQAVTIMRQSATAQVEASQRSATAAIEAMQAMATASNARPSGGQQGLVDSKGIGKPNSFKGETKSFLQWKAKFINWCSAAYADAREMIGWCIEVHETAVTAALITDQITKFPEIKAFDKNLWGSLTSLCEDGAFDIVSNSVEGSGLDAFRRLSKHYDPPTHQRNVTMLSQILKCTPMKLGDLSSQIEKWEEQVRLYSNRTKEVIPDSIKRVTLIGMCPEPLHEHLELNQSLYPDYQALRVYVDSYLMNKLPQPSTVSKSSVNTNMDISALGDGSFAGECYYCGNSGHRASECRKKKSDEWCVYGKDGDKGGKDNGKGNNGGKGGKGE